MWSTAPLKAATWLAFATSLSSATPQYGAPPKIQFKHWPEEAATALSNMITKNANQSNYAVFDMDKTR
jgi:extradiol dioxygenase family protein